MVMMSGGGRVTLCLFIVGFQDNLMFLEQLAPCPTHSAPSVSRVIGTEQDVSVNDQMHCCNSMEPQNCRSGKSRSVANVDLVKQPNAQVTSIIAQHILLFVLVFAGRS